MVLEVEQASVTAGLVLGLPGENDDLVTNLLRLQLNSTVNVSLKK